MSAEAAAEPVLEARVERRHLRKFADALAVAGDVCRLHVDTGGLSARVVDRPNVMMTAASLPARGYDARRTRGGAVGLPVEWLAGALRGRDERYVGLEIRDGGVRLDAGGDELVAPRVVGDEIREPDFPEIDDKFTARVTITGREFGRFVESIDEGYVVEVSTHGAPESVVLAPGQSSMPPGGEWTWDPEGDAAVFDAERAQALVVDEHGSSLYSVGYLADIADAVLASPPLTLRFADEFPLSISYPLGGLWTDDEWGRVEHLLAPRIRDGDS